MEENVERHERRRGGGQGKDNTTQWRETLDTHRFHGDKIKC